MANDCSLNIQANLNDLYQLKRYEAPAGALKAAYSPENGAELQATIVDKNGMNSQYSIKYIKPQCTEPVSCNTFDCSGSGTDTGTLTGCITDTGFLCKSSPTWQNIGIGAIRDLGNTSTMSVFAAHLWDQIQKFKAAINVEYIQWLCTKAGCFGDGSDTKLLDLFNADGAPNFTVDGDIMADYADAGFGGVMPVLLGNRQLMRFMKAQAASGMSASGINLGAMERFPMFYDPSIVAANCAPNATGNEVVLSTLPGIANILSWSENVGMFASRQNGARWDNIDPMSLISMTDTYLYTVIEDPSTGHLFDLNIVFDAKCKKFQYQLKTNYQFVALPLTGCVSDCFTGVFKYDVCPATAPSCAPQA